MSGGRNTGPDLRADVEETRGHLAEIMAGLAARTDLRPHIRQATAEITARICTALPVAAVATAATGLATAAIILLRRRPR